MLTLKQCLNEEGLTTYVYKVNESQLQTGDIIHYKFNDTGHYEYYIKNNTDLTGFTGHIITIRELKDQEQVPLHLQEKIRGQCPPCAALIVCLNFFPCQFALGFILRSAVTNTVWCAEHQKECGEKVGQAMGAAKAFAGSGHKCQNDQCVLRSRLTPAEQQKIRKAVEHIKQSKRG